MCWLASQRCSIFGQSVSWITNFSHIFQYLQCLYHVSSYAKAAHGEFNCYLLSVKKRSTSCNCSLEAEPPSLRPFQLLTRGPQGWDPNSPPALTQKDWTTTEMTHGTTERGCNLHIAFACSQLPRHKLLMRREEIKVQVMEVEKMGSFCY